MHTTTLSKDRLTTKLPEFDFLDRRTWLAGGCIRCAVTGEEIQDYDVFGTSAEVLKEFIEKNLLEYRITHHTDFVQSYRKGKRKIQVITGRPYADIVSCLKEFDFTICQFAYDGTDIVTSADALCDSFKKKLVPYHVKKEFALDTMRRVQKFVQRGYTICNGGIKTIAEVISGLDKQDIEKQVKFYADGRTRLVRFD